MREPATVHLQSLVSENEHEALRGYLAKTVTAKGTSSAIRELISFALTELGYMSEDCNGNITSLVRAYKKTNQANQTKTT